MDDFTGTVCGNNVKYPLIGAMREELRGVSRGKDAKDVDWEKVAASFDDLPVSLQCATGFESFNGEILF